MLAFTATVEPMLEALVPLPSILRDRLTAQMLLNQAIRAKQVPDGGACVVCGNETRKMHAHHTDYSRPLDVVWLCAVCHSQVHQRELARKRRLTNCGVTHMA